MIEGLEKGYLLVYVSPLIISAVLGIFLSFFISRNRLTPSARALFVLILAASLWSAGYALEFLSPALATKLLWAKFQYFGITTIPLAWFVFAFQYREPPGWSARPLKYLALLGFIPLLTLCLVWTNELHGLIWRNVKLQAFGPVQILEFDHGPAFWVYWAFSYGLLILGSAKLVVELLGSTPSSLIGFRRQVFMKSCTSRFHKAKSSMSNTTSCVFYRYMEQARLRWENSTRPTRPSFGESTNSVAAWLATRSQPAFLNTRLIGECINPTKTLVLISYFYNIIYLSGVYKYHKNIIKKNEKSVLTVCSISC